MLYMRMNPNWETEIKEDLVYAVLVQTQDQDLSLIYENVPSSFLKDIA